MKSFVALTRYYFALPESAGKFILSEHLNQDPLEGYFGKQRMKGGRSDNPSAEQFLQNATSIRLQGSVAQDPVRGNSSRKRLQYQSEVIDDAPLPKRRKSRKGTNAE